MAVRKIALYTCTNTFQIAEAGDLIRVNYVFCKYVSQNKMVRMLFSILSLFSLTHLHTFIHIRFERNLYVRVM